MTCTNESYEAMAAAGQSQEDINLLRLEVELARAEAKAESFRIGDTLATQQKRMDIAERQVRKVAHDRWHRKLDDMMKSINEAKAEALPVAAGGTGHSHTSPATRDKLKKLGFE